jgi:hypothetical protein
MIADSLQEIIAKKSERQTLLKHSVENLNTLEGDLTLSRASRGFGSVLLLIQRLVMLLLGIASIGLGLFLMSSPYLLTKDDDMKQMVYEDVGKSFTDLTGQSIQEYGAKLKEDNPSNYVDIEKIFYGTIEKTVEKQIVEAANFMAILCIILGAILIYVSYLTNKLYRKNKLIGRAEADAQCIIDDFKKAVEKEQLELEEMKKLHALAKVAERKP